MGLRPMLVSVAPLALAERLRADAAVWPGDHPRRPKAKAVGYQPWAPSPWATSRALPILDSAGSVAEGRV
jgi:hypothetical protein